ncbi:hypothetical protein OMDBNIEC_00010 [Salmonella phage STP-SP5]|nr:hypothetical protein OMDBNIEC_00010 [Salmonella phage STP-SP5]
MAGKENAVASATVSIAESQVSQREPWKHGDKPVIYIHSYYWDNMSVEKQASLKELADVFIVPEDVVPPETPEV